MLSPASAPVRRASFSPALLVCLLLGLFALPLRAEGAQTVTLLLSNLSRVYDATPAVLDPETDFTISPGSIADYDFRITYAGKAAVPVNAGNYAVRVVATHRDTPALTTTVNDTLVIARAPLIVTADNQARLLGVANPRFTLSYEGFVAGQTETAFSRRPAGATTAKTSSPAGTYEITVNGGVAKNYEIVERRPGTLTVIPAFPGTYEALLFNFIAPNIPAGKLTLTLPARGANFTGRLDLADESAVIPVSGKLTPNPELTGATGFAERRMRNGDTYRVEVIATPEGVSAQLFLRENGSTDNLFLYDQTSPARLRPYTRAAPSPAIGAYTLALLRPALSDFSDFSFLYPTGSGFATVTIANTGLLKLTGLLADKTKFTASLSPDEQDTYRLFIRPYGSRVGSYVAGALPLEPHPDDPDRFHVPDFTRAFTWKKAPKPSGSPDRLFPDGFSLDTTVVLDPWLAPAAARRATATVDAADAITLAQRLGVSASHTLPGFAHLDYGSNFLGESANELPPRIEFTPANRAQPVLLSPPDNPTRWTITVNAKTGRFTARFRLIDEVYFESNPFTPVNFTRNVVVDGVLRQPPAGQNVIGAGHFILAPLPGALLDTEPLSSDFQITRD